MSKVKAKVTKKKVMRAECRLLVPLEVLELVRSMAVDGEDPDALAVRCLVAGAEAEEARRARIREASREPDEGWGWPAAARKPHYFRNGRSLCGHWGLLSRLHSRKWDVGDCRACARKLEVGGGS